MKALATIAQSCKHLQDVVKRYITQMLTHKAHFSLSIANTYGVSSINGCCISLLSACNIIICYAVGHLSTPIYCRFEAHFLQILQRPDALPEYREVILHYYGHITSFGMAGHWCKMQEGVKQPVKEQAGVWALYAVKKKAAIGDMPADRAETDDKV